MPIVLIDGPPPFTSIEEHRQLTSATPESFADIPPVLRHKEENATLTLDPPLDDFPSQNAQGTLYVTESVFAFVSNTGKGFSVDYPTLILHAVSRAEDGPLLYCQLDESVGTEVTEDDEVDTFREIKIKPASPDSLETIFEAISLCASMNADFVDDNQFGEDDADDAFIDADESAFAQVNDEEEMSEVGRAALAHLESIIDWDHPASGPRPAHLQQQQQTNGAAPNGDVVEDAGTTPTPPPQTQS